MFEIEEKADRISDRMCTFRLKENSRRADIECSANPIVQFHTQSELIAFSSTSLLEPATSSFHNAVSHDSDVGRKQLIGGYIFLSCSI